MDISNNIPAFSQLDFQFQLRAINICVGIRRYTHAQMTAHSGTSAYLTPLPFGLHAKAASLAITQYVWWSR